MVIVISTRDRRAPLTVGLSSSGARRVTSYRATASASTKILFRTVVCSTSAVYSTSVNSTTTMWRGRAKYHAKCLHHEDQPQEGCNLAVGRRWPWTRPPWVPLTFVTCFAAPYCDVLSSPNDCPWVWVLWSWWRQDAERVQTPRDQRAEHCECC